MPEVKVTESNEMLTVYALLKTTHRCVGS